MELNNTFTVNLPVQDTWQVLMDLERVARCIPGAAILDIEGETYHGAVKIKVGPVSTQYKGIAKFVEKDPQQYRAVIKAVGSDAGGQGNADSLITINLTDAAGQTKVDMLTEVAMSGRVAQFGRGVVADVANRILKQFVKNLEADLASGLDGASQGVSAPATASGAGAATSAPVARPSMDDIEPLDAFGNFGDVIAKYAVPAAGALVVIVGAVLLARRPGGVPSAVRGGFPGGPAHTIIPIIIYTGLPGAHGQTGWASDTILGDVR